MFHKNSVKDFESGLNKLPFDESLFKEINLMSLTSESDPVFLRETRWVRFMVLRDLATVLKIIFVSILQKTKRQECNV